MLTGEKQDRLVLLTGKSWRIVGVDWKRQTVWLEPAKEGGNARWTGTGRTLSREIAQGMLRAVQKGAGSPTVISKRARIEIDQVIEDMPETGETGEAAVFAVTPTDSGSARLWTFSGTCANRTLARQIAPLVEVRRLDAIGLDLKMPMDPSQLTDELPAKPVHLSDDEIKDLAKPIKFSQCVPTDLLLEIIRTRQFGAIQAGQLIFS